MTGFGNNEDDKLGSFSMGRMRPPPEPKRKLPKGLLTAVVLAAFAGIIWYAYPQGAEKYTDVDVPVIQADATSYKSAPENPGGMDVPHQDSTVFAPLEKQGEPQVEKIMPLPEEPMNKDQSSIEDHQASLNLDPQTQEIVAQQADKAVEAAEQEKTELTEKVVTQQPVVAEPVKEEKPVEVKKEAEKPTPAKALASASSASEKGTVYIQLGAYRQIDGASVDWKKIQKKHPDLLGGLTMKTEKVDVPGKGTFYRLQAGKVSDAAAKEICAKLKSSGTSGCIVVKH